MRAAGHDRPWAPTPGSSERPAPMLAEASLAHLHRHWALRRMLDPEARPGPVSGVRSAAKALAG
ncbi:MAG: hypothetical protein ACRDZY_22115, partial [Acidimicrobiales bacterium]